MQCLIEHLGKLLWHLLPTLTAIIISGFLIQRFYIRKANAAGFVDNILKELQSLRSDSLEYWSSKNSDREEILASQLKGSIQTIAADIDYYCKQYKINKNTKISFDMLQISLADAVTGGEFEQKKRKLNSQRYFKILNAINNLRSEIHKTKI